METQGNASTTRSGWPHWFHAQDSTSPAALFDLLSSTRQSTTPALGTAPAKGLWRIVLQRIILHARDDARDGYAAPVLLDDRVTEEMVLRRL